MRIRVLGIRGLPATYSGLETIMGELAPRWVEAGHEVIVYCRKALFKEDLRNGGGIKLVYLPSIEHKMFSTLSHSFSRDNARFSYRIRCHFDMERWQRTVWMVLSGRR